MLQLTREQYNEIVDEARKLPDPIKERVAALANEVSDISATDGGSVTNLLFLVTMAVVDPEYPVWDD